MSFKKINVEKYKELINKIILNENIRKEIIDKIDDFNQNGEIVFDGYNLYAKNKKGKDYLELKYENNYFLCNYSECDFSKFVTISLKELKSNNVKLERKEKVEYIHNDNFNNSTEIEEIEEIYNADKNLAYESKLSYNYKYVTYENAIIYVDNHYFTNYFDLNKKWYIFNGSIINYKLTKSIMNEHSEIEEKYSICPEAYHGNFATYYNYVDLDQGLFKQFMSGSISIDDVLEQIDKEEFHKMLSKSFKNDNCGF